MRHLRYATQSRALALPCQHVTPLLFPPLMRSLLLYRLPSIQSKPNKLYLQGLQPGHRTPLRRQHPSQTAVSIHIPALVSRHRRRSEARIVDPSGTEQLQSPTSKRCHAPRCAWHLPFKFPAVDFALHEFVSHIHTLTHPHTHSYEPNLQRGQRSHACPLRRQGSAQTDIAPHRPAYIRHARRAHATESGLVKHDTIYTSTDAPRSHIIAEMHVAGVDQWFIKPVLRKQASTHALTA
jgi:hypothetical protein